MDHKSAVEFADKIEASGIKLSGKTLLDVGCGDAGFMDVAATRGAEVWGIDHAAGAREYAAAHIQSGACHTLTLADLDRFDAISFGQTLPRHPEWRGKFDIVTILLVAMYMTQKELVGLAHMAHHLLKKDGCLLLQVPNARHSTAYQVGQDPKDSDNKLKKELSLLERRMAAHASTASGRLTPELRAMVETSQKIQNTCNILLDVCFADVGKSDIPGTDRSVWLARKPRAQIPPVTDIVTLKDGISIGLTGEAEALWPAIDAACRFKLTPKPPGEIMSGAILPAAGARLWTPGP